VSALAARAKILIHPIFCDDIFIGVVYIASVDIGVALIGNIISANEDSDRRINLISGSFLAIGDVGQWRLNQKGRYR
jgi:hypothetical protein